MLKLTTVMLTASSNCCMKILTDADASSRRINGSLNYIRTTNIYTFISIHHSVIVIYSENRNNSLPGCNLHPKNESRQRQLTALLLTNCPMLVMCCQELPSGEWLRFTSHIFQLLTAPSRCPQCTGSPRAIRFIFKSRMAALQSGEGCMMIDSVVWAQYINVTDIQKDRQTHSHVTIANTISMHCVGWQ